MPMTEAEMLAQRREEPTVYRAAMLTALYGTLHALFGVFLAIREHNGRIALASVCLGMWIWTLSAKIREKVKWAWWLGVIGSLLFVVRYALGLLTRVIMIAEGRPDWPRTLFYGLGGIVVFLVAVALLSRATRAKFGFGQKNPAPVDELAEPLSHEPPAH